MKFVDATGFPVEPSAVGDGYWYRTDIPERERWARRILKSRSQEAQGEFYGSDQWMAVQRLLAFFQKADRWDDDPARWEPSEHLDVPICHEIAFEVE